MAVVSPLKLVREYFDMKLAQMKDEWSNGGLTTLDKEQIVQGLTDGTETY